MPPPALPEKQVEEWYKLISQGTEIISGQKNYPSNNCSLGWLSCAISSLNSTNSSSNLKIDPQ